MSGIEQRDRLTAYHKSEKVKVGIEYFAKPPAVEPAPEKPDPLLAAQHQLAQAYFLWAQALRGK